MSQLGQPKDSPFSRSLRVEILSPLFVVAWMLVVGYFFGCSAFFWLETFLFVCVLAKSTTIFILYDAPFVL